MLRLIVLLAVAAPAHAATDTLVVPTGARLTRFGKGKMASCS